MRRRGTAEQGNNDDKLTSSLINTQTTVIPSGIQTPIPYVPIDTKKYGCFDTVTNFANQAIQSAATTFAGFKGAMKDIMSKLSEEQQRECLCTFGQYHELLMTTQRFTTRTLIRVQRAHRTDELLKSIDLPSITALCGQIRGLLIQFRKIEAIIDDKVKDERTLTDWRNILCCALGLAVVVCLVATGVGVGLGFIAAVKGTIAISAT
ncbi:unnamed protein product, partial [Rotaria sordida]